MPGGTGTHISQFLPQNVRNGLVSTPTPASAANYYLTLADLNGAGGIYSGSGNLVPGATTVTGLPADRLTFTNGTTVMDYSSGAVRVVSGVGLNPIGFGVVGDLNWQTTGTSLDNFTGIFPDLSNNARWQSQIYDNSTFVENAGFINEVISFSGTNRPLASMYYLNADGVTQSGFQANVFGERILSQASGLNRLSVLNASVGIAFLSGSGGATGYIGVADQAGFASWFDAAGVGFNGIFDTNNNGGTVPAAFTASLTDAFTFDNIVSAYTLKSSVSGAASSPFIVERANATNIFQIGTGGIGDGYANLYNAAGGLRIQLHSNSPSYINNNQGLVVGHNVANGIFKVRGTDSTNLTRMITVETLTGAPRWLMQTDGQSATGIGTNAALNAQFAQINRANGYNFGYGFYSGAGVTTTMTVQMTGADNKNGISVATQGAKSGTIYGIQSSVISTGQNLGYGIFGNARNSTGSSRGVWGNFGGGDSVIPGLYGVGVEGSAVSQVDSEQYGGRFITQFNNIGLDYTEDQIGLYARSGGPSAGAGTTSDIIAGKFEVLSASNTSGDAMAILVPSSNEGVVVIGADNSTVNNSLVQVSGDLEIVGTPQGIILEDRTTGLRQRFYLDNGNLEDEAA